MASFSINHIVLLGNVTKDVELKMSKAGKPILKFSIATNHSQKNADGTYTDIPTFHNVVVFGKIADWLSKNLHRGSKVYVDGRLTNTEYTDKAGVVKRWVEVFANNCIPMDGRGAVIAKPTQTTLPVAETLPVVDETKPMDENVNPGDLPF